MANTNYSTYNQAQYDNQSKYLNNLISSGSYGDAEWAKKELATLNSQYKPESNNTAVTNTPVTNNTPAVNNTPVAKAPSGTDYSTYNQAQYDNQSKYLNNLINTSSTGNANWAKQELAALNAQYKPTTTTTSPTTNTNNTTNDLASILASYGYANDMFGKARYVEQVLNSVGTKNSSGGTVSRDDVVNYLTGLGFTVEASKELGPDSLVVRDGDKMNQVYLMSGNGYNRGNGGWTYGTGDTKVEGYNPYGYIQPTTVTPTAVNPTVVNGGNGATDRDLWYENQKAYLTNLINNGSAGDAAWAEAQLKNLQPGGGTIGTGNSTTDYSGYTLEQYNNQKAYLTNLINNGTTGQATWAQQELQHLNASLGTDGYWHYNGSGGTGNSNLGDVPRRGDYSELINNSFNTQADLYKQANELATKQAVDKLKDTFQNSLATYQTARDQSAIDTAKALDNQVLMSQLNGDTGGLANKQYGVLQAAGNARLQEINLEQQNLYNTTMQQIAQLEAQGAYEQAIMLAELANARLEALINEADKVYQSDLTAYTTNKDIQFKEADLLGTYNGQETVATKQQNLQNALTRLQMGIFSEEDAKTLGIPADQAKEYANYINTLAQLDIQAAKADLNNKVSGGISSGGIVVDTGVTPVADPNVKGNVGEDTTPVYEPTGTERPPFTGSTYAEAVEYINTYGDEEDKKYASSIYTSSEFIRKKNSGGKVSGEDIPLSNFATYQDYLKYMTATPQ